MIGTEKDPAVSFRIFNKVHGDECKNEPLLFSSMLLSDCLPDVFSSLYLGASFNIINSEALCRVFSSTIHLINIEHLWYPFRKGGL